MPWATLWLLAALAVGPVTAAEAALPGQGLLPDNRAWELVSPPDKNGGDVSLATSRTQIAADGSAVQFASLVGFGDANGVTLHGSEYIARRGAAGWTTHGITPTTSPRSLPAPVYPSIHYQGDLSSDLDSGVFLAPGPLSAAGPNVQLVANLYVRDDLLTPGAGNYSLLSDCPGCSSPLPSDSLDPPAIAFAGASDDYSHVIFESGDNLTGETTGDSNNPKLYEWLAATDTIRYVGVLPNSACGTPPCFATDGSAAGNGAGSGHGPGGGAESFPGYTLEKNAISDDGSRIFFTAAPFELVDNTAVSGDLYVRENGTITTQLNVSERSTPDPGGHRIAFFGGASGDGSKVFFTTSEQLTDDDVDGADDLYRADLDAPAGNRLELVSPGSVKYLTGISQDGEFAYYIDAGTDHQLYVWHQGSTRHIASLLRSRVAGYDYPVSSFVRPRNGIRVTPDGRHVAFIDPSPTTAQAVGFDNAPDPGSGHCDGASFDTSLGVLCTQVYLYDYDEDSLSCASCNTGHAPVSDAYFHSTDYLGNTESGGGAGFMNVHQNRPLPDDGSLVFFSTGDALVPEDQNGKYDAYQYDVDSGEVALLSSGKSGSNSYFMESDPSGANALIATREQLVGVDVDANVDLYSARAGGGLPGQSPPGSPPGCSGDECQGASSGSPADAAPGSRTYAGPAGSVALSCSAARTKAIRLGRQARRLGKSARRASGRRAVRLRKRAKAVDKQANRARRALQTCRGSK